MTDKARELLERAMESLDGGFLYRLELKEKIRDFLSTPEPAQDELLDFCDTHCTWRDHHPDCPLKAKYGLSKPEFVDISDTLKPTNVAMLPNGVAVSNVYEAYEEGLKEPAPRPEFVRLSEEEVNSLMNRSLPSYELICAVENRLVEKNSINRSDPDSIDLQSRCRGDKL